MDRLNQWLSLTANIGVLVGVGFLIVELDQNTSSIRLAARQALTQENSEYVKLLLSDPDLGVLFSKAVPPRDPSTPNLRGLNEQDQLKLGRLLYIAFINLENQYHAWKDGALTDGEWKPSDALLNMYADSAAVQDYWETGGSRLHGTSFSKFFSNKFEAIPDDK